MVVVIPMAGEGKRFSDAGYTFPKPLISIRGKPMIQWAVESLSLHGRYIFVAQREVAERYHLDAMLRQIVSESKVVTVEGKTEGALCTVLEGLKGVEDTQELVVANCDQFLVWRPGTFLTQARNRNVGGAIAAFQSVHPKWSFLAVSDGLVQKVAEKVPISRFASCGVYYFSSVKLFKEAAARMIAKNMRVNGEFYLAPVYNEIIDDGDTVMPFFVDGMWGLGTPEDLEEFKMFVCAKEAVSATA